MIGTTTDVALILNTASSPLPIINTPIPIAGFYVVGATLLAAVYCYLHFYLLRLWRTLATLPAVFPDGTALDDRTDPWLLTGLVRTYMSYALPPAHWDTPRTRSPFCWAGCSCPSHCSTIGGGSFRPSH